MGEREDESHAAAKHKRKDGEVCLYGMQYQACVGWKLKPFLSRSDPSKRNEWSVYPMCKLGIGNTSRPTTLRFWLHASPQYWLIGGGG